MRRLLLVPICITIVFVFSSCGTDSGGPNPQIDRLQPDSGPPGTMVTINGSGFSPEAANNTVTFGGTNAPVNSSTESSIETEVPDGLSQGSVPVEVMVGDQTASGPSFTVEQAAPGISSVEPDSGTVGTEVTITGMNFSATDSENTIEFNGTQSPVNGAAEDQLLTEVPQGATDGPIEVTVKQKSTTGPDFDVITDGTLELITSTSGSDKDSDGYTAAVDGGSGKSVAIEDTLYFADLEEGSHDAQLSGIADNCSISGSNPRSVSITAGDTASTTFDVSCQAVANDKIVFYSDRDGNDEIYLMNGDGSGQTRLTNNAAFDGFPVVSNDGTRIAFSSDRNPQGNIDLYIMDADGSDMQRITNSSGSTYRYSWSPNDSKLVFQDNRSGSNEIYVINTDGSGLTRLTNNSDEDIMPTWSPDGNSIAFTSDRSGNDQIHTMNTDGSGVKQITSSSSFDLHPEYSPDGSKLALTTNRTGSFDIHVINTDGSGVRRITDDSGDERVPSWSPDGSELVFQIDLGDDVEVYKINSDGSGTPVNLTANPAKDEAPHWSAVK